MLHNLPTIASRATIRHLTRLILDPVLLGDDGLTAIVRALLTVGPGAATDDFAKYVYMYAHFIVV